MKHYCCYFGAMAQTAFNVVQTDAGKFQGSVNSDASGHAFKGIPFAAPPIGELRWKAPQPVTPWMA
jgi:para-nitrobenzyl esterase